jgi:hypothetical protein
MKEDRELRECEPIYRTGDIRRALWLDENVLKEASLSVLDFNIHGRIEYGEGL